MEYTSPILVLIALWLFVADFFTYRRHKQKFPVLIVIGIVCIIVAALLIPQGEGDDPQKIDHLTTKAIQREIVMADNRAESLNTSEDYNMSIVWITKDRRGGRHGGVYAEYYDKPVIVTTPNGEMLLTPAVMAMLGHPKAVRIGIESGYTIILQPSDDVLADFKVQYVRSGKDRTSPPPINTQMARVSANQLTRHNGMISDSACFIFTVEDRGGFLGIDVRQKRGIIPYKRRDRNNGIRPQAHTAQQRRISHPALLVPQRQDES